MKAGKKELLDSHLEKAKSEFVSIISHHLRTPIASVRWTLDALRNGQFGALNKEQRKALNDAYQHNAHLAKVVSDLLRVSWLEEQGIKPKPRSTQLSPTVRLVSRRYETFAKASNTKLRLQVRPISAYIDPAQFEWLCSALIHNAILYSRSGGAVIVQTYRDGNWSVLRVRDNGIGIPAADQKKMFTKFFRGTNARRLHPDGLGLDLYVINRIVTECGGTVQIKSKENDFTDCTILLPQKKQQGRETQGVDIQTDETLRKERQFVAITVHELRTPLSNAKWSLEVLRSQRPGPLTAKQRDLVDQLYAGTERLLVLVRDMLNMSKLQQGNFEIRKAKVDFTRVIKNSQLAFANEAKSAGVSVQFFVRKLPSVSCDVTRVAQVLNNIISNAIKYTKRGGKVLVSVSLMKKSLSAQMPRHNDSPKNGYVLVSVTDTGIGIAKTDREKVFMPFFRSKTAMSSGAGGTGLGLYIAKSIIEMHGGNIWFESTPGKGSTFNFTVPVA